jgi:hypothetical protein
MPTHATTRPAARPNAVSRRRLITWGAAALLPTPFAAFAQGVPTIAAGGTRYDAEITLAGQRLTLNGAGTRYRAIFKVYDLALYTARRSQNPEELVAMPGAKRLNFVALRELPGTDLGRLLVKGLQENNPREAVQRHMAAVGRLGDVFAGKVKLMPGDSFAIEFVPGRGTLFYITGTPQGDPIPDPEFFGLLLRIWLGKSPADWQLKDALLGQTKA